MSEQALITLTEAAAERVRALLAEQENEGLFLRVFVTGGGCSGFQYGFAFDDTVADDDLTIESNGVRIVIDPMSLDLMRGSEIDYQRSLAGESFVIRNPNAAASCGCGKSFTPAEDGGCAHA
ncbi:MAG: iron-sulfur cluster insertion protein ErpA [Zetaproteobacteria bacterium]|nr:MAG: iron-sulfur cluster insertion protein ErpA [Zetaproteobacteria bacterium]